MKLRLDVNNQVRLLFAISIAILVTRLIAMYLLPFYDTTESRYGEIARIMLETGNFITPQFNYDVPFWGKPPLHTWLSTAGFGVFGINEFAGRIFHFVLSLVTIGLVALFVKQLTNSITKAIVASTVLVSTIGFTIAMGMVMTESALIFCTTLALISYWNVYRGYQTTYYSHLLFVALATGLIVKGPVACVMIGIGIFNWCLITRDFKQLLKLSWFTGLLLMLAISLPWYVLAELSTPGFLEYFIIGEHIERFLVSGWQGDLYGSAHKQTKGMIWVFWLAIAFPWSFVIFYLYVNTKFKEHSVSQNKATQRTSEIRYLICWLIAPLLLFTLASNILPIYGVPTIAALAIIVALVVQRLSIVIIASSISLICLVVFTAYLTSGAKEYKSDKYLLADLSSEQISNLYQLNSGSFSSRFYTKGKIKKLPSVNELPLQSTETYILTKHQLVNELTAKSTCRILKENKRKVLLACQKK